MLTALLKKLIKGENLSASECEIAFNAMLSEENTIQSAAFLCLMQAKGETSEELTAFVKLMQSHQMSIETPFLVLDIVGTGGDGLNTVNISTAASILAASCGVPVLKHGNRAASSQAGSADVIEALGLQLSQTHDHVLTALKQSGFGFCFAPLFHPVLKKIKMIRTHLKLPTFFNLLGPLLNPAQAQCRIVGVANEQIQKMMADVLVNMKVNRAMVVTGHGLDELSCIGPCHVIEIDHGVQTHTDIDPQSLGFSLCAVADLKGGNAQHNARLIEQVFDGVQSPLADTIMLNAAAGVYLYGKTTHIDEAVDLVRLNIKNGKARLFLHQLQEVSHA